MAIRGFGWSNFFIRLIVALFLVFATYNPSGYSWVHWLQHSENKIDPLIIVAGVLLLIGWVIFLRATARSLGFIGSLLVLLLFGSMLWAMVSYGWLSLDNPSTISWVALTLLALLLAIGISWSHIRRRLTGQLDVDDVEDTA
jgi:uncharacterized membrane-anchored protein